VKVALSVLALLVNLTFVVYIGYVLVQNQGVEVKDVLPSFSAVDSQVTQALIHGKNDGGVFVHAPQETEEEEGGTVLNGVVPDKSPSERELALRQMMVESDRRDARRISFDKGTRVLVERDDETTFSAVTASRSRHLYTHSHFVSVMVDNKNPSVSVEVPCSRVRPLELKEEDNPVGEQAANSLPRRKELPGDADGEPDAKQDGAHLPHMHPATDKLQPLPSLLPFVVSHSAPSLELLSSVLGAHESANGLPKLS
jgi:hypothetical protein